MIRVGGGWDTLEHYLDRHDPCRCGFQGHRGGRGASTPRRASTTTVSKSLPGTPKTSRKLSLTAQVSSTHSGSTPRPASPSMRSASPGPTSRKLSLTGKGTVPQPAQSVTSPNIVQKKPNFSNSGQNVSGKIQTVNQTGTSSSGSFPVGSFVKQSQISLSRQLSSGSTGSQPPATPRRSASPSPRPQSPSQRRSESPAPVIANRLRSPSPAPMTQKGSNQVRPQSVPATQRCASPVKQITLSELRSSREGKVNSQTPSQTTPRSSRDGKLTSQATSRTLRRQASTDSNKSRGSETEMMAEPGSSNFAIDKISTMSLGEFRSLLNSALSVPNGNTESQCSSDSPRSQGSVDSGRNISSKPKSTPAKSAYSYRSVSASRTQSGKPSVPSKSGIQSTTKTNLSTQRTAQNLQSNISSSGRPTSAKTNYRSVPSSGYGQERPKTPNSMPRSRSNASSVSDNSYTLQPNNRSTFASRSSSHSSIQSCESTDDGRNSYGTDYGDQTSKVLSPSSVDSDYSFRGSSCTSSEYTRSNSYTPCSAAEEKIRLEKLQASARASSEPRENISSISKDIQNAYGVPESKPINVGYATFSYDKDDDSKDFNELDEIEDEIIKSRDKSEDVSPEITELSKTDNEISSQSNVRPQTPSGRQTPSFIPRPITPKVSRKLSLPQNGETEALQSYDEKKAAARPPTPKKSTVIARAHGSSGVRSADKSKEQTYRELFQKRSATPGPGSSSSSSSVASARRSMTPGPYLNKTSTLRPTSATTNRARLNEAMEGNKGTSLSVFSDNKENSNISSTKRTQIIDKKMLTKQNSTDQSEAVIVVNVDRSEGRHSLSVQGENEPRQNVNKPKVLARARTEDNRARTPTRSTPGITRQRPQSVEPRQLIPRKQSGKNAETVLTVKRNENGTHGVYDRTQEWVQTAVEQTKVVQKTKVNRTFTPRARRAMTPNSFDMRIDQEKEEPRSLEEIKAALTLPINGLNDINPDKIDAPPEDPEMYATMEKLFHELRQQELKNSVNETPGSNVAGSKVAKSKSSKSNSSNNDEEMSLDSNRNIKTKTLSVSTKSSSNVTSPTVQRSSRMNQTPRGQSMSRTSSTSSASASQFSNSQAGKGDQYTKKASTSSSAQSGPVSTPRASRPSSPGPSARRPPSPRTTTHNTPRPESPRITSQPPRPASPRVNSHPPRPASPRVSPQTSRPASPSLRTNSDSSRGSTPSRTQPPRPASTPPRAYSPVARQSSKSSEDNDNVFEKDKKSDSGSIMKKIKEIIKVNPRKDKTESGKGKSRIPAPKSLASAGKSRSFSNLSNLSHSLSMGSEESNGHSFEEHNMNGYGEYINGGLNVTLSGRSETPKPKLNTPLTTGRSSLIRKESMEKNKSNVTNRLVRAMSVERNMSGLNNTYHFCDEGEYV
ncbi:serine/arginine repetitive matrix protein 2-like isoform X2 [Mercenaria mercenaria]|nr:serine/arginine repetitive matrix protein 2-like isoform X2 [Mercenaria mercenaria]